MKRTGQFAKVTATVGTVVVGILELREWSISASTEKIDANVAGDEWNDHLHGRKSWEGEATCISADQYWLDMLDKKVEIAFFDHEDDLQPAYVGTASVDFERGTPHDDVIESTLTFTGAGALTSPAGTPAPTTP